MTPKTSYSGLVSVFFYILFFTLSYSHDDKDTTCDRENKGFYTNYGRFLLVLHVAPHSHHWGCTRSVNQVMRLVFYLPKFLFLSNINVIPFIIVPLGNYTPMETLFPLSVAALEVFNWCSQQHVCSNRKKRSRHGTPDRCETSCSYKVYA